MQPTTAISGCMLPIFLVPDNPSLPLGCANQGYIAESIRIWISMTTGAQDFIPMQRLPAASLTSNVNDAVNLMTQLQTWKPQPPCNVDMKTIVSPS